MVGVPAVELGDPKAKERTEKCLAKLDDAQAAMATAAANQLSKERAADVGQPIENTHWGRKVCHRPGYH